MFCSLGCRVHNASRIQDKSKESEPPFDVCVGVPGLRVQAWILFCLSLDSLILTCEGVLREQYASSAIDNVWDLCSMKSSNCTELFQNNENWDHMGDAVYITLLKPILLVSRRAYCAILFVWIKYIGLVSRIHHAAQTHPAGNRGVLKLILLVRKPHSKASLPFFKMALTINSYHADPIMLSQAVVRPSMPGFVLALSTHTMLALPCYHRPRSCRFPSC